MFRDQMSDSMATGEARNAPHADLAAFFGPHAEAYIRAAEPLREARLKGHGAMLAWTQGSSWSWPAFWTWYVWFLYRKCYWEAAATLVLVVAGAALDFAWPEAWGAFSSTVYTVACMVAKPLYFRHAFRAIARADAMGLVGEDRHQALARAGGVSKASAAAGTVFLVAAIVACAVWRWPDILAQADAWGLLPPQ